MDADLDNKTFLVTGASGGIGISIAKLLAKEHVNLILQYFTNKTSIENLTKELNETNIRFIICKVDLSKEKDIIIMFQEAKEAFGRIDGLINNAGIWPSLDTPIYNMTTEQWDRTISINLRSIFLCSKYFLQNLLEFPGDNASIVLVSSTAGVFGEAGHIDYSSSKSALHGFMLSLKNEIVKICKYGRVNSVSPGWTRTPMAEEGLKDKNAVEKVMQTMALRKIASSDDIANTIIYLLSDRLSGHASGQNIIVAGGMEGRIIHS